MEVAKGWERGSNCKLFYMYIHTVVFYTNILFYIICSSVLYCLLVVSGSFGRWTLLSAQLWNKSLHKYNAVLLLFVWKPTCMAIVMCYFLSMSVEMQNTWDVSNWKMVSNTQEVCILKRFKFRSTVCREFNINAHSSYFIRFNWMSEQYPLT